MSVYVDNPKIAYGRMKMCHMIADSIEELHQTADQIGIKRKWFQDQGRFLHYDICMAKRDLAISVGAIEVSSRDLVKIYRRVYGT